MWNLRVSGLCASESWVFKKIYKYYIIIIIITISIIIIINSRFGLFMVSSFLFLFRYVVELIGHHFKNACDFALRLPSCIIFKCTMINFWYTENGCK